MGEPQAAAQGARGKEYEEEWLRCGRTQILSRLLASGIQAIWVSSAQAGTFSLQRSGVTMEDVLLTLRGEPFGVRHHS